MNISKPTHLKSIVELLSLIIKYDTKCEESKQKLSFNQDLNLYALFSNLHNNQGNEIIYDDILLFLKENQKFNVSYNFSINLLIEAFDYDNDKALNYEEFIRFILPKNNNYARSALTQRQFKKDPLSDQVKDLVINIFLKQLRFLELLNAKKIDISLENVDLSDLFIYLDYNQDSFICINDLRDFLFKKTKQTFQTNELYCIISLFDLDKDCKLNFDEFLLLILPSQISSKPNRNNIKQWIVKCEEYYLNPIKNLEIGYNNYNFHYKYTNENDNLDEKALEIKRKNDLFKMKNNLTNNIPTFSTLNNRANDDNFLSGSLYQYQTTNIHKNTELIQNPINIYSEFSTNIVNLLQIIPILEEYKCNLLKLNNFKLEDLINLFFSFERYKDSVDYKAFIQVLEYFDLVGQFEIQEINEFYLLLESYSYNEGLSYGINKTAIRLLFTPYQEIIVNKDQFTNQKEAFPSKEIYRIAKEVLKLSIILNNKRLKYQDIQIPLEIFNEIDAFKRGFFMIAEFEEFLLKYNTSLNYGIRNTNDSSLLFNYFDVKKKGKISKNDFLSFLNIN